jgi:hypothetical protein
MNKTCSKCHIEKPLSDFARDSRSPGGLQCSCRECQRAYYIANKERLLAQGLARYAKNKEKILAQNARWKIENKAKHLQQAKDWYAANKDRARATRAAWTARNPGRKTAITSAWFAANPGLRRIYKLNRRARVLYSGGELSKGLGAKLFALQKGKCACCAKPLGKPYHMDHIIPLVRGGLNIDSNIQLLRPECNMSKGKKEPIEFMQSKGLLL